MVSKCLFSEEIKTATDTFPGENSTLRTQSMVCLVSFEFLNPMQASPEDYRFCLACQPVIGESTGVDFWNAQRFLIFHSALLLSGFCLCLASLY